MHCFLRVLNALFIALFLMIVSVHLGGSDLVIPDKPEERAQRYTRVYEFDYLDWTLNAIGIKISQAAIGTPFYFNQADRHKIVSDYLMLIDEILNRENHLGNIYGDPSIPNPASASAELRSTLESLYARQRRLAPLAEAVLEQEVAAVLHELGLTTAGQPIPPVSFHISPLPYHLVISPRDKIQQDASISLVPDLTVDKQAALEEQVASALDISALVVPVGGIGSYPTMVMRTTSLNWLADTIAHEWIHNWLNLRPLGINYLSTPELRTMNETTASIAGAEIALVLLDIFYPKLAAQYSLASINLESGPIPPGGFPLPEFDYQAEMHSTRVYVDELLAEGKIEEAEAYMEQRRQVFWENGYQIRKLNQAYFAFYGAYADVPGGTAGEDPVGPAVRLLRAQHSSLADFLKKIAAMSSYEDLQKAVSP